MAKNPFNQRNPRLINDLRAFGIFTTVESSLQIKLFMQNKAKFRKVKLNVNKVLTKDYEQMDTWSIGKKQSQTNPNKAKFKKTEMNVTSYITMDYENISPIWAPKKQSQFPKRQKPIQTSLPQRIMKKTAFSGSDKTKPNKPNFRANIMLLRMTINPRRVSLCHYADWRLFDRQIPSRRKEFWATNFIS